MPCYNGQTEYSESVFRTYLLPAHREADDAVHLLYAQLLYQHSILRTTILSSHQRLSRLHIVKQRRTCCLGMTQRGSMVRCMALAVQSQDYLHELQSVWDREAQRTVLEGEED